VVFFGQYENKTEKKNMDIQLNFGKQGPDRYGLDSAGSNYNPVALFCKRGAMPLGIMKAGTFLVK
jgi:hypothetical protein